MLSAGITSAPEIQPPYSQPASFTSRLNYMMLPQQPIYQHSRIAFSAYPSYPTLHPICMQMRPGLPPPVATFPQVFALPRQVYENSPSKKKVDGSQEEQKNKKL